MKHPKSDLILRIEDRIPAYYVSLNGQIKFYTLAGMLLETAARHANLLGYGYHDMIKDKELGSVEKLELTAHFDQIFGLKLLEKEESDIPEDVRMLAEKREKARNEKNYELSDKYRDMIRDKGFEVRDSKEGQTIEKL